MRKCSTAFLAETRPRWWWTTPPRRANAASATRSIPAKYKNVRPLDAIPASELKNFEEAAKDFYDKAAPDRKDVHPYETFLRLNFKLPDPEREPDAYLVYGEDFERQLLVLWGCEKQKDTALPVARHEVVRLRRGEETVADKLRRRLIGWEQMQKDALLLLAKTREPLFRFIGQPVIDDKGILKGVKIGEVALTSAQIRPLRYILPPEMKAFQKACADFYSRADTATSAYEKELRRNFQLPDPDKMPEAFRVHGPFIRPRMVILCVGHARKEQTIRLTPAPELNIPPMPPVSPEQELLGHKPPQPPTLTDKLQRKTIPFAKIFSVAAAIVATPLVILLLIWLSLDKFPPKPVRIIPGGRCRVHAGAVQRADRRLLDAEGRRWQISKSFVSSQSSNASRSPLFRPRLSDTGPLQEPRNQTGRRGANSADGTGYELRVNGLKEQSILHNEMRKAVSLEFVYNDLKPPVLGTPSGDGESLGHLVLPFTKQMDRESISGRGELLHRRRKLQSERTSLDDDKKSVILTVSPDMPLKSEHKLVVRNVKDASRLEIKSIPTRRRLISNSWMPCRQSFGTSPPKNRTRSCWSSMRS